MSGYQAITGADGFTIWHPRTPRAGKYGLILFPGQGHPNAFMDGTNDPSSMRLAAAIASCGIPVITSAFLGNSWGNDAMQAMIPTARAAMKAAVPSMSDAKVCVGGFSMGDAAAVRYSQLHPDQVAAVFGIIPAYDPKSIYIANNVGDAAMEAAWGFSGLGNFPAGLDLAATPTTDVPIWTGYASDDPSVPTANVIAYHTAAGGLPENLYDLGAVGHDDDAVAAVNIPALARFLVANGA